jgi:putative ABC transport system permease protein
VRATDRLRQFYVSVGGRRIPLGGLDAALPGGEGRLALQRGDPRAAFRRLREEGAVLVGEPLARKAGLGVGDSLVVFGPRGRVALPVVGVYADFTSEAGSATMDLAQMARRFGPGPVNNVALYLEPGRDPEAVVGELRARFAGVPLRIRSNRALREEVLHIFDQTFAVTRLLQAMSLLIAVSGVALTLLVLARERVSELALYRALGAGRRQVFRVFVGKGLGMSALGLALGAAGGAGLALVLVYLINPAYFGWTIRLHWPWGALAGEAAAILAAAVLASLYPALRASRTPATELTRDDL